MATDDEKAGEKTGLVEQPHGGAIYQGPPANPVAGTGRPPDEFKAKMRELASRKEALRFLAECVDGHHGPQAAIRAHQHLTERGYGKVPQEITGADGGPVQITVTRRVVRADD